MYLCICNAIREGHVDGLLEQGGARTVAEVFRHLGKSPQCGACVSAVRERVQQRAAAAAPAAE